MKTLVLVGMLVAMLVVAWLVVQSVTAPTTGQKAPLVTIDRAREARSRAEQAAQNAGRTFDDASRE